MARVPLCVGLLARLLLADDAPLVINELMYHPPGDSDQLQFIELLNPGGAPVDLSGWYLSRGISYVFPAETQIPPGAVLVVCRDQAAFSRHYGTNLGATILGGFSGRLSHSGETVTLCNAAGQTIDTVTYSEQPPWPQSPDGASPSLERVCPRGPSQEPGNWAPSSMPLTRVARGTPGRTNDSYSSNLPPLVSSARLTYSPQRREARVAVEVADADRVKEVAVLWHVFGPGGASPEEGLTMRRESGDEQRGVYAATLAELPSQRILRWRIRAVDTAGSIRVAPSEHEVCPAYSQALCVNTNTARIPWAWLLQAQPRQQRGPQFGPRFARGSLQVTARGQDALIWMPPNESNVITYDFVRIIPRNGGLKVHLPKGHDFQGMSGINILSEGRPRWLLSEHLSYELFRLADVPTPASSHARVYLNGQRLGHQLIVEQPNRSFLRRQQRDDSGNLYKLLWYERGIVGQHEKKTRVSEGHADLVALIEGLNQTAGEDQWRYIQQHFNVREFINYFAVSMCNQNWDGYWNNYFAYHDTGGTGRWEIYPWDNDKTWGDYDGASPRLDWYTMPLAFGANNARSPMFNPFASGQNQWGGFGGVSWWRPPGWFSGPMLANPQFRHRFLSRLHEICLTIFEERRFLPIIDDLERRLAPEFEIPPGKAGASSEWALKHFRDDIQSFRNQLRNRRAYILAELKNLGFDSLPAPGRR